MIITTSFLFINFTFYGYVLIKIFLQFSLILSGKYLSSYFYLSWKSALTYSEITYIIIMPIKIKKDLFIKLLKKEIKSLKAVYRKVSDLSC